MRRRVFAVFIAALALGVAGCDGTTPRNAAADRSPNGTSTAPNETASGGSGASSGSNGSSGSSESKTTLAAAADTLSTKSARFQITTSTGVQVAGVMDVTNRQSEMSFEIPSYGSMDIRALQSDLYVRGLPGRGKAKWVHYTTASLEANLSQYRVFEDAVSYLKSVSAATQTGKGQYEGTIDAAKVAQQLPAERRAQFEDGIKLKGPGGGTLTFQATLDDQGRLISLTITVTANGKTQTTQMKYSDYGVPATVERPPASLTVEP